MITQEKVIEIYSMADDFCKFFSTQIKRHTLEAPSKSRKYHRDNKMSDADKVWKSTFFDSITGTSRNDPTKNR